MRTVIKVLLLIGLVVGGFFAYQYRDSLRSAPVVGDVIARLPWFNATPTPPTPMATPLPTPPPLKLNELPITLPMLDALFFADPVFPIEARTQLQLSDEQVADLRHLARAETQGLRESASDAAGTTQAAGARAAEKIGAVLGNEKAVKFAELALLRWQTIGSQETEAEIALSTATPDARLATPEPVASPAASPSATSIAAGSIGFFAAPNDTRIVVNAPAYRMDVFENGQLVKSYKTAIGYPAFPTPMGLRKATQIIFNPTWTPPDEPWVESSATVKVGQKIAAGDKLNPLGVIKIPIGSPSLIHGGKPLTKIGNVGSHGCVGLTDAQVSDFAKLLGRLGGISVTDEDLAKHAANRTKTQVVKLKQAIPVELRYETVVVEDGKLYIYRDVYDRAANRRENLEAVLNNFGITLADLTEAERAQVETAIAAFFPAESVTPTPTPTASPAPLTAAQKAAERKQKLARDQQIKALKAKKVAVIEIAALAGKGYPAPTDLDSGTPAKTKNAAASKAK